MPVLSRFYGIVIRMYFQQAEHNPPHIHALYGEDMAAIDVRQVKCWKVIYRPRRWQWYENGQRFTKAIFCICGRRRSLSPFPLSNKELIPCFIKSKQSPLLRTIA